MIRRTPFVLPLLLVLGCSGEGLPPAPAPTTSLPAASPSAATSAAAAEKPAPKGPVAPIAKKEPRVTELHGVKLVDDYAWLSKKDAPEVLEHLRAENAYSEAMTAALTPVKDRIYGEILGRLQETDVEVPSREGAYLYYTRTEKGKQYPIYCRKAVKGGDKAPEEIVIDPNEIAKTEKYVGLGPLAFSEDGNLLAYGLDTTGFRQFVLHVRDLKTGKDLADRAERVTSVVFAKDGKTLFYTVEDPVTKRSHKFFRHNLGDDAAKDALLYEEKDERFRLHSARSSSKKLIFVQSNSHTTSEVRFLPADKPSASLTLVEPREQDHEYDVDHRGDELVIRTNSPAKPGDPKSTNYRLVVAKVSSPGRASWKETIAHRKNVMIEFVELFSTFAVAFEREDGLRQIRVLDPKKLSLDGSHRVTLPEPIFTLRQGDNREFDATFYRFRFESPTTPPTVYDYEPKKRALVQKKRVEVPNYDPGRYESKRVHATAKDGTKIPVSLLYKKGTNPDGKNPLFLYAYGSYGFPIFPMFSAQAFSLVDRGVVCAIAHIRGGGELGEIWHDAGRMKTKMNTFTDFVDATEGLVQMGWAAKDRIAIQGASAGGLLMGAVLNMRPDLYRAAIADVPFVDVINTMLDESLPLTVEEFEEWGNPKKKDEFEYIARYSPYENVGKKAYPSILVNTSYNDSQVMYWEPAKWVAKLREMKTDQNQLLLRIHLDPAGHGGKSGRYERMQEMAFKYAWLLDRLEVKDGK
ncbi:S9 family peptidase [Polyangium jinanense]|uniref:S9 family peptidase n=1 Tax=Polyangium jinanense TaxID=2829994 RepID=A0A9X3X7C6_9BACT|nr:S9 family peptidase [Polyangium jinanense]MDC3983281.1 S9 family peptidase [Polyangium jinanense]MDC3985139.1 S9 family peptidase [Polyangium jinanense]